MKIEKCKNKVKCDFDGCGKFADFYVAKRGFINNEFAFCKDCLKEFYEEVSKEFIPTPIESHYKPNRRKRSDEQRS